MQGISSPRVRRPRLPDPHAPAALTVSLPRRVRFEEVDSLHMMWHGNYTSWMEDGREAVGEKYGIHYLDFHSNGVVIPIKTINLDFKQPLRYRETYSINTTLHWNEAALLEFCYTITGSSGLMTVAHTTQLMLSTEGTLLLEAPEFYRDFCRRWRGGQL